ncbi:ATP-binding protein [Leptospira paudalimensis]|uniref:AAA family ATPase n=1 Tax=Leptospira paudalimensis TaxID=2950024 RepID=A0ABT3M3D9_9LEPT|nr:AAA family ATPase [Leptospira paudalimensis]MCW7502905.1 AAA family ATPase [Leptospira paudalimensis]
MKLKLENFGIFSSKEFPIERITVFTGPNESGKTTILDAFVSALVKVVGSTKYGTILNVRYQANRKSDLGVSKQSLSQNLYLNSLVIREGNMDVGSEKELIQVIEQSIFDSGYNPTHLKEMAEQQVAKTGVRKVAKDWMATLSELESAKQKFDLSERTLNQIANQFAELPTWELERQSKKAEVETLTIERTNLQKQFEELKEKELHTEADRVYQQILQWEMFSSANKEEVAGLQVDAEKKAKELEENIRSKKQKISLQKEQIGSSDSKIESVKTSKTQSETKFQSLEFYYSSFETWKETVNKFQQDFPVVSVVTWNPTNRNLAFGSFVGVLISLIAVLFTDYGFGMYLPLILFLGLTLFFGTKMKDTRLEKDESKWNEMVRRIASEMETKTLGVWKPDSLHLDSLQMAFQRFDREYTKQKLELQSLKEQITKLESEFETLQNQSKKEKLELEELETSLTKLYQSLGVKSLSELSERLVEARLKQDKIKTLEDNLRLEGKKWGTTDTETLKLKLKDKISDWEKKGIGKGFELEDRTNKQKLETVIQERSETIRHLEQRIVELEKKLETGKAVLESQMVPAQREWESSKKILETKEKKKAELEKNYQAFEVLIELFSEMEAESTDKMSSLVRSLQHRMDAIKGSLPTKQIKWDGFSDEIQVETEANEAKMGFGQLSTGTREQISYVLRLEYAFRIGTQYKLPYLLLDEPFRHMDNVRRNAALEYTLQCILNAGEEWKLVLFSFDEDLVTTIKGLAEKWKLPCQIHSLIKPVS